MKPSCIILLLPFIPLTWSWSQKKLWNRRHVMQSLLLIGSVSKPQAVPATCLAGDTSVDCIGVYKLPTMSQQDLKRLVPDAKYVPPAAPPKSAQSAVKALSAQRKAADDIAEVVAAGRLEEAGIKMLNLIPKVTTAGRVILDELSSRSSSAAAATTLSEETIWNLRTSQMESKFEELLGILGQCDVSIGQGLRGQMGVSAVAQLSILSELREVMAAFDDFLAFVPRDLKEI